ncbi:MAG TPA: type 1 glutamine amidotransferase domain-containing protein [Bacillales bacterium]|nr:type 1 glutamine amidotransferase domain-containing protein [Bacillales bacterium]
MASKNVLMVLTNFGKIDENNDTGLWLEEFTIPYETFVEKGYDVTVASPSGGEVPVDPRSEPEEDNWKETRSLLKDTRTLASVNGGDYDAVFLPGGHGTMFDFPEDENLQNLLATMYEDGKVVGAVCHGPAGLTNVKLSDGTQLVDGKTLTAFTNEEESGTGLEEAMPFLLESKLREQGAHFVVKPKFSDHVEADGRLVTGQNPPSSRNTALSVIDVLEG